MPAPNHPPMSSQAVALDISSLTDEESGHKAMETGAHTIGPRKMTFYAVSILCGIICLRCIIQTNPNFMLYSPLLKKSLGISQEQLNILFFASDAGKYFTVFSGVAANHLPLTAMFAVAVVQRALGYGLPFLFLIKKINLDYYWSVVLFFIGGNSISWLETVSYIAILRSFPADLGAVVGLTTSYSNLSPYIYTVMYKTYHELFRKKESNDVSSTSKYLLLYSSAPFVVAIIVTPALLIIDLKSMHTRKPGSSEALFSHTSFVIAFTVASVPWLMTVKTLPFFVNLVILFVLIILQPVVLIRNAYQHRRSYSSSTSNNTSGTTVPRCTNIEINSVNKNELAPRFSKQYGVRELLQSWDFWLYFAVYMFGPALSMVYQNQLGQIAVSRGILDASTLLAIYSFFNSIGKLASGFVDGHARQSVSRQAWVFLLMISMTISYFLLLIHADIILKISTAFLGFGAGFITSIAVTMIAKMFGQDNFSINYSILILNIPIGYFLFGYLPSELYDQGNHWIFTIWGCISAIGTVLSYVLYRQIHKHHVQSE